MNNNKKIILVVCGLFILLSGLLYMNSNYIREYLSDNDIKTEVLLSSESDDNKHQNMLQSGQDTTTASDNAKKNIQNAKVVVYICGAVKKPGVYKFEKGSRVNDAINAASGFSRNAAKTAINQARVLKDGEQITIPTLKQLHKQTLKNKHNAEQSDTDSLKKENGLININTASASELTSLSGIGQSRADAIIEYRESNGKFKDTSDIMKISGIKEGIFNKIKNKISV